MTARTTWKAFERRLARDARTDRIPVTGERAGADFEAGPFAYQCKLGRRFPACLRQWITGIAATGQRTGRIGVLVWKPKHGRDADALVMLRWADWVDLHGAPVPEGKR